MDHYCDAFEKEVIKIDKTKNTMKKSKAYLKSSIFLSIAIGILLAIGFIHGGYFILRRDCDAAVFYYLQYCAFAIILWLRCKHQQIRKYAFVSMGLISLAFYSWAIIEDGFDEILVIVVGTVVVFAFVFAFLRLFTNVFKDFK
jgi:hypothetical protein